MEDRDSQFSILYPQPEFGYDAWDNHISRSPRRKSGGGGGWSDQYGSNGHETGRAQGPKAPS
jgi:hypothetical protein